jgi:hypothetical protein
MKQEDTFAEAIRAEDIFLGGMGLAEDAKLEKIHLQGQMLFIIGSFSSDGEQFKLLYDCEIGDLELWALEILRKQGRVLIF